MPHTSAPGTSVTARALSLLAAFDTNHQRLGLTELAARAAIPISTAHRLISELVAFGALERVPSGEYVIGQRMWDLGLLAPQRAGLAEAASPFLHDLYGATHVAAHVAVRDGARALYLDRVRGNSSVPIVSTVGSRLPLYSTGVGKVLLAYAPEVTVVEVLSGLARITPHTITQPGTLRRQLTRVRREGYATTVEEMSLGGCSIAVPIRDGRSVVAALGVVVPSLGATRPRLVAALRVAAGGIERVLGGQPNRSPRAR